DGPGQQRREALRRLRCEDAIENGAQQQRQRGLRRTGHRHERHRSQQMDPVAARIAEQAQQFVHTATRRRATASRTWALETPAMPSGAVTIWDAVRHGPQIAGSEAPKITTTGRPKAAAMWAGPESLPMKRAAWPSTFLISA